MNIYKSYRFLSKKHIEDQATNILKQMECSYKLTWPLDPTQVAEFLELDTEIINLPYDEENAIAAMIWPIEGKILINEHNDNLPKGFQESSIAHEIGHWELHIDKKQVEEYRKKRNLGLEINTPPPLNRIYKPKEQENIEWQAQYFASCLLMPQYILKEKFKARDLTKWSHLYAMRDELGVTISNLTNRLQDLRWIYIPKGSQQIYKGKAFPNG